MGNSGAPLARSRRTAVGMAETTTASLSDLIYSRPIEPLLTTDVARHAFVPRWSGKAYASRLRG